MKKHDEDCTCVELAVDAEFTITTFFKNTPSERLKSWYDNVYLTQHPKANDFDVSWSDNGEGQEVLEIMAHNPFFPASALVRLFESYTVLPLVMQDTPKRYDN